MNEVNFEPNSNQGIPSSGTTLNPDNTPKEIKMDKTMEDVVSDVLKEQRIVKYIPYFNKAMLAAMKEWETLTNKSRDEVNRGLQNACKKWEEICGEQKQEIERLKGLIKLAHNDGFDMADSFGEPSKKHEAWQQFKTEQHL